MSYTILEEEAEDDKPENDHYSIKVKLVRRYGHYAT